MRTLVFFSVLLSLSLSSCNKKEGCRDPEALNFDASAEKNGTCRFTKVIFYAPSDRVRGTADRVVRIEIYLGPTPGQELISTIDTFDHPVPGGFLAPEGAFEYEIPGSGVDYMYYNKVLI